MAIETSGNIGGVAIARGSELLLERQFIAGRQHASQLLPVMDQLCREVGWQPGDIEHLYLSIGPGSFTGLRIAVACAKALAFAQHVKIVSVPSTEALALNARRATQEEDLKIDYVATILDAKKRQIYAAVFEKCAQPDLRERREGIASDNLDSCVSTFRVITPVTLMMPEQLLNPPLDPLYLLGEGLHKHRSPFSRKGFVLLPEKYWIPQAGNVHACGWQRAQAGLFSQPDQLIPAYMRRPEAVERWEKLHGV